MSEHLPSSRHESSKPLYEADDTTPVTAGDIRKIREMLNMESAQHEQERVGKVSDARSAVESVFNDRQNPPRIFRPPKIVRPPRIARLEQPRIVRPEQNSDTTIDTEREADGALIAAEAALVHHQKTDAVIDDPTEEIPVVGRQDLVEEEQKLEELPDNNELFEEVKPNDNVESEGTEATQDTSDESEDLVDVEDVEPTQDDTEKRKGDLKLLRRRLSDTSDELKRLRNRFRRGLEDRVIGGGNRLVGRDRHLLGNAVDSIVMLTRSEQFKSVVGTNETGGTFAILKQMSDSGASYDEVMNQLSRTTRSVDGMIDGIERQLSAH